MATIYRKPQTRLQSAKTAAEQAARLAQLAQLAATVPQSKLPDFLAATGWLSWNVRTLATAYASQALRPLSSIETSQVTAVATHARVAYQLTQDQIALDAANADATVPTPPQVDPNSPAGLLASLPSLEAWTALSQKARSVALRLAMARFPDWVQAITTLPNPNYPGQTLTLDPDQVYAILLFLTGKSFVLTGAAGTGKTLTEQAFAVAYILKHKRYPPSYVYKIPLRKRVTRELTHDAAPAHFIGAFTNKAVGVLSKKILANPMVAASGYGANLTTVHALLEFEPVEMWSDIQERVVRRYMPARTRTSPLAGLEVITVDEASTIGVGKDNDLSTCQLWTYLYDAIQPGTQVVLVGDLNQLPPVGGKSILSYGVAQLPVHELTYFHRQAAESPIIAAAHAILRGEYPEQATNPATGDRFIDKTWRPEIAKRCSAIAPAYDFFKKAIEVWMDRGDYDPMQDMLLTPMYKESNKHRLDAEKRAKKRAFERSFATGSAERGGAKRGRPLELTHHFSARTLNRIIGTMLARKEGRLVYCVQAGFERHYLAIGDRVLVNNVEGTVTDIRTNWEYGGKRPPAPSINMDYWGKLTGTASTGYDSYATDDTDDNDLGDDDIHELAWQARIAKEHAERRDSLSSREQEEERKHAASHEVAVELETGEEAILTNAAHFSPQLFQLGYAMTVHKAQGSEWRNVYVILHEKQSFMASRELLYTAVTRARNGCFIYGHKEVYQKAISNPRIKGDTLAEKIAYFADGNIDTIDLDKLA